MSYLENKLKEELEILIKKRYSEELLIENMSYVPTINVKKETAEVKFYFPIIKDGKGDVQVLSALFEYIPNGNNGKYWYCRRDWRD